MGRVDILHGYATRLLTCRSWDQILAAVIAFTVQTKFLQACVLRFRCMLNKSRWWDFLKLFTAVSLIVVPCFWDVKRNQLLLLTRMKEHTNKKQLFAHYFSDVTKTRRIVHSV